MIKALALGLAAGLVASVLIVTAALLYGPDRLLKGI